MKTPRIDIGSIRREQIVDAAIAVIAEQGLQSLSLSEIETKAGMSRGQLTYYFPTKESILVAVFDRHVQRMHQRVESSEASPCGAGSFRDRYEQLLKMILSHPPVSQEFGSMQYTFLSQVGHREDFRERLATLYETWRGRMSEDLTHERQALPGANQAPRTVSPRAVATFLQAVLHGLAVQMAADPEAVPREEMLGLCLDLLCRYLGVNAKPSPSAANRTVGAKPPANGAAKERSAPSSPREPRS